MLRHSEPFFVLSRAWDKEKILSPVKNGTSDLWIPHSNALPLSHRDSTVSEVYHEVDMTPILHIARISNVDSIIFVDRNKEWSLYGSVVEHQSAESEGLRFNSLMGLRIFSLSHTPDKKKNTSFSISFPS